MGKQHLDALAVTARLLEGLCAGERTSNVTGTFMDAARDLTSRLLRAALPHKRAGVAIEPARPVQQQIVIHDFCRSW